MESAYIHDEVLCSFNTQKIQLEMDGTGDMLNEACHKGINRE